MILGFGALYWNCIETKIAGLAHDDGVYLVLAKALAEGKGFVLAHLDGEPPQIKYPVLLPWLLSLVWRVCPNFPGNLSALSLIPVTAATAGLGLTYGFLRCQLGCHCVLALLICIATGLQYQFAFYASSILSESLYFALSVATLWLGASVLSLGLTKAPLFSWGMLGLIVCSALAFHTRMIGLALVVAITVAMTLQKQWRQGFTYLFITLLLTVGAWLLWTSQQTLPGPDTINWPLIQPYRNYGIEILENIKSAPVLVVLGLTIGGLISGLLEAMFPVFKYGAEWLPRVLGNWEGTQATIWVVLTSVVAYGLFGFLGFQLWQQIRGSKENSTTKIVITGQLVALYCCCYFGVVLVWGYDSHAIRFIAVVLPWLWLLLLVPLWHSSQAISNMFRLTSGRELAWLGPILAMTVWLIGVAPMAQGVSNLRQLHHDHVLDPTFPWFWSEYEATFTWIRENVPKGVGVAGIWDPAFYLYTDHPSAHASFAALARKNARFTAESYPRLFKSLCASGIGFVAMEPQQQQYRIVGPYNPVVMKVMALAPEAFQPVYQSPNKSIILFSMTCPKAISSLSSQSHS